MVPFSGAFSWQPAEVRVTRNAGKVMDPISPCCSWSPSIRNSFLVSKTCSLVLSFACKALPTPSSLLFPAPDPFLLHLLKEILQAILFREPSGWKILWWAFYTSRNSTNFGSFSAKNLNTLILWSAKKCSSPWTPVFLSHTRIDIGIHTYIHKKGEN